MSSSKSSSRGGDGDWICADPECANLNFARRTACNRCGKEKLDAAAKKKQIGVEIGKAAAEKSRGLFSADDWQCTKCGNVNWARRQQCNMCNAPKFGEVEERTGYGGGYNDRGVVEYIEREESDDEYDEFGRKKKRFRKCTDDDASPGKSEKEPISIKTSSGENSSKSADIQKKSDDEEDEEEDDDDDDDGDLSKYDLSGWGDDDDEDSKEAESKDKEDRREGRDKDKDDRKFSSSSSSRAK